MVDQFNKFYKGLQRTIQRELKVAYPQIGVIVDVSPNREFCSVETENGVINNIPAHGMPVIGDSAVIHFVNGNYEQPLCDCARRMPTPTSELEEMYTSQCLNYHNNGDFSKGTEGYVLNDDSTPELFEDTDNPSESGQVCLLNLNDELSFEVDISSCETEYFKFQCCYQGNSYLAVGCQNAETNETIKPLPLSLEKEYSIWESPYGRFGWAFNKEAYTKGDTEKIKISLKNINKEKIPQMYVAGNYVDVPTTLSIDALLVYDENGDTQYYNSVKDLLE